MVVGRHLICVNHPVGRFWLPIARQLRSSFD